MGAPAKGQSGTSSLGVGLIGLGWMGRLHSEAHVRTRHHYPDSDLVPRLVIAADSAPDRRREALALGYGAVTQHWEEVVSHPQVHAVSVTAPNWLHRDIAVAAARAGKHIWIEKPVGRDLRETSEIASAVAGAGVRSRVGFDLRYAPTIQRARTLVQEGVLGEIRHARATFLSDYASDPQAPRTWRFVREQAGSGALGDLMVHIVDLLAYLVAPIDAVCATAATAIAARPAEGQPDVMLPVENEDFVSSLVRFANGAQGVMEASRVATGRQSYAAVEIHGTLGALAWSFDRMNELQLSVGRLSSGDRGATRVMADTSHGTFAAFQPGPGLLLGYDDLKVMQAHDFARSIALDAQSAPGMDEAVRAARTLAAMERSWVSGGWEGTEQEGKTRSEYGKRPVSSESATRSDQAEAPDVGDEERET